MNLAQTYEELTSGRLETYRVDQLSRTLLIRAFDASDTSQIPLQIVFRENLLPNQQQEVMRRLNTGFPYEILAAYLMRQVTPEIAHRNTEKTTLEHHLIKLSSLQAPRRTTIKFFDSKPAPIDTPGKREQTRRALIEKYPKYLGENGTTTPWDVSRFLKQRNMHVSISPEELLQTGMVLPTSTREDFPAIPGDQRLEYRLRDPFRPTEHNHYRPE